MNKSEIFNHYSNMLDTLIEDTLFFQYYFQSCFSMEEDIEHPCMNLDWYIHFGATRVCLEDRAYDYVVKTDLATYDYEACGKEEEVYAHAREEHLDKYFIEPIYLGTYVRAIRFYDAYNIECYIDNFDYYDEEEFTNKFADNEENFGSLHEVIIRLPLYAYKRAKPYRFCDTYEELGPDEKSDEEIIARAYESPLKERNLAVAIEFVKSYGEDEYARLSEFLDDYEINDLHAGNIYGESGKPIIADFAGYSSCY